MPMQVASVSGTSTSYGGSALYVDAINPDGSFIEVEGRRSRHDSLLVPEKKEAQQVMDNEAVQQADKAQRAAEAARRAREEQLEEQLRRSIEVTSIKVKEERREGKEVRREKPSKRTCSLCGQKPPDTEGYSGPKIYSSGNFPPERIL